MSILCASNNGSIVSLENAVQRAKIAVNRIVPLFLIFALSRVLQAVEFPGKVFLGPQLKLVLNSSPQTFRVPGAKAVEQLPIYVVLQADPVRLQAAVVACGGSLGTVIDDIATAFLPPGDLVRLAREAGVSRIELVGQATPHLERFKTHAYLSDPRKQQSGGRSFLGEEVLPELPDATALHYEIPPLDHAYTGKGVVIGFFDSGINFHHLDFRDPGDPSKSRILSIWDPQDSRGPSPPGRRGTEWTREQIEATLNGDSNSPSGDQNGHGTAVAGTATGNGTGTGSYAGVAPEADIVMVISRGLSYLEAADYIYQKAAEIGKPAVVNFSKLGSVIPGSLEEKGLEKLVRAAPGRAFVASAGNGGNYIGHWGGFSLQQEPLWTYYKVFADSSVLDEPENGFIWLEGIVLGTSNGSGFLALALEEEPEGQDIQGTQITRSAWINLSELAADSFVNASSDTMKSESGDILGIVNLAASQLESRSISFSIHAFQFPKIRNNAPVVWRFMAKGQGIIHVWTHFGEPVTRSDLSSETGYRPLDNRYMVPSPAASGEVIAAGAYANIQPPVLPRVDQGDLLPLSSRGPTIHERIKPDLVAPGVLYTSSHVGIDKRVGVYGTSFSAPVVAGAVALYFERFPQATNRDVWRALTESAASDEFTGVTPNFDWGYGKLDVAALLQEPPTVVAAETGEVRPAGFALEQNYPNPFNGRTSISYQLPGPGAVELILYGLLGQPVRRLVSEYQGAGFHRVAWDGTDDGGHPVASGVYLYRLKAGDQLLSRRLVLVR